MPAALPCLLLQSCSTCKSGFFVNGSKKCAACSSALSNCLLCNSTGKVQARSAGLSLGRKACVPAAGAMRACLDTIEHAATPGCSSSPAVARHAPLPGGSSLQNLVHVPSCAEVYRLSAGLLCQQHHLQMLILLIQVPQLRHMRRWGPGGCEGMPWPLEACLSVCLAWLAGWLSLGCSATPAWVWHHPSIGVGCCKSCKYKAPCPRTRASPHPPSPPHPPPRFAGMLAVHG